MDIKSYEQAFEKLEQIVEDLENEDVSIDQLAEKVEMASELLKYCRNKLRSTESKVNEIIEKMEV